MFEEYLRDAYLLAEQARGAADEPTAKRCYRAAVFHAAAALEAFVNYVGITLAQGERFAPQEIALLTDKKFALVNGEFCMTTQVEYHRIEDKLVFLLTKFRADFDRATNPAWSQLMQFKDLRDVITHPKGVEDEIAIETYQDSLARGLGSTIKVIDVLCRAVFSKPLRRSIRDLAS